MGLQGMFSDAKTAKTVKPQATAGKLKNYLKENFARVVGCTIY